MRRQWYRPLQFALVCVCVGLWASMSAAVDRDAPFASIDGGEFALADFEGRAVLVVNTASLCAFSDQYRDLQALYDRYRARGLVVVAIPSDDFNQELDDNAAVKEFCELVYGLDLPMSEITSVRGRDAHPFYRSLQREAGFTPRWNFNKVLLDADGAVVETFNAQVGPLSRRMIREVESVLPQG